MVISQMHMYVYSMYVYMNVCMTQLDTLCMSLFVVPAELCITMEGIPVCTPSYIQLLKAKIGCLHLLLL